MIVVYYVKYNLFISQCNKASMKYLVMQSKKKTHLKKNIFF